ncbi:MAG: putative rane protein [Nocardioidaceae bacterium]|nr:putative rane protein [Nocardioidaceae bacterium]
MTSWRDRLRAEGSTPDPRMTLANERTFLAWIRTALAMVAGGIGLDAFAGDTIPAAVRVPLSVVLLLLGALLAGGSWARWLDAERALRRGDDLPVSRLTPVITSGVMVVALALVVVVLVRS